TCFWPALSAAAVEPDPTRAARRAGLVPGHRAGRRARHRHHAVAAAPGLPAVQGRHVRDSRYAALSVVPDGDGYVLGSRYSREFVAVPAIGGDVVRWLQEGYTVEECAERAADRMGEPV